MLSRMSHMVPEFLGSGLYTAWPFCFSRRNCLGLQTFVFWFSVSERMSSDCSNEGRAVPSLRGQQCCSQLQWPPFLTSCLYFRQKWTLRDWETRCKYICPSDRSEKRIDLRRAWIPAERAPVYNSCLFNQSIAGGRGGLVGERVFTFNSKTEHKRDLGEERDVQFWGSGIVEYQCKGCGESCLKRLRFQMGTAQLQPRGQARVMLGCSSLTSLQGLQNTNTPAPHSTLVWFFDFFFI